ncbi:MULTISPECIES: two-component system activity regulator YycH [Staphylococcus]|uniref:two-component system activity regulator YycH n=1 Tax=Staphylococcus TaxID=1279 RepID=UPI00076B033E|nr:MULTISPECIES: two-component system activity regulator YycH [Staphylococcus]AMG64400.1 hypothetical protein AL501_09095 [Staphylococcus lugdunensis]MCI2814586.1 two-component system activity regulator YycH [Staphylococcus lugdunensis]MDU0967068.1 two-component system activity regulator YycH [Staphylococcus lugdunensis]MDU1965757.1 two-component system activity regulator YycH [Staphylococcus lugdunensis]MDU2322706.1 two-component system activity regulator YycH [Staphylococcus lugdunensis]
MSNRENIKSIILILLVLMSVVLTYMIWNFTPDLTHLDSTDSKKVSSKSIGKPMSAKEETVISPFQIIRKRGDDVKGIEGSKANILQMVEPLKKHKVKKVEKLHHDYNLTIPELTNHYAVLDFTYDLPLNVYLGQVLDISAKIPKNFNFNRILIDKDPYDRLVLYAISKDRHDAIKLTMDAKAESFIKSLDQLEKGMTNYSEIITNKNTIDKATHVFAPKKPKEMMSYRMVFDTINVEVMNAILFDDSVIVRSGRGGATTYNNNTGVANYNNDSEKYHYRNLSEDESSSSDMETTIPSTFDYINSHGGFVNDDYRLFSTDNHNGQLTYQMFLNGHPTFSKQHLNQIQVTWGDKGIYDYQRALLRSSVPLEGKTCKLPSVESVRSSLANDPNVDFEKVTNITVGYKENDKPEQNDIEIQRNSEFMPKWYIEYDGEWYAYENGRLE